MLESLLSCLAFVSIAMATWGLGRPLDRWLNPAHRDSLSVFVWGFAFGLVAAGTVLTGMGLLGLLYTPLIGVMTFIAGLNGLGEIIQARLAATPLRSDAMPVNQIVNHTGRPSTWLVAPLAILTVAVTASTFIAALAPATAGDAL